MKSLFGISNRYPSPPCGRFRIPAEISGDSRYGIRRLVGLLHWLAIFIADCFHQMQIAFKRILEVVFVAGNLIHPTDQERTIQIGERSSLAAPAFAVALVLNQRRYRVIQRQKPGLRTKPDGSP